MLASKTSSQLLFSSFLPRIDLTRSIARIPHYEYHIRFDPTAGRKRPCQDVLDRFKRLNNGMWIRARAGRKTLRYQKNDMFLATSYQYMTCTKEECFNLDKLMTPYWLRQRHYVDDPYEPYHVRHNISSPRVDYKKRFVRERRKVLLDDSTAEKHFPI